MKTIKTLPRLPKRKADSHKGDYGRVLVVAGSVGMSGAACLAAESALRAGAGLVTLALPKGLNIVAEIKVTCVISHPLAENSDGSIALEAEKTVLDLAGRSDCVALGPGIGRNPATWELVLRLVQAIDKPMVIDADGLNALATNPEALRNAKGTIILTPHPGEMARLAGLSGPGEVQKNRMAVAGGFARRHKVIVALKGHETVITDGAEVYVNPTGNPGMASAGAGDVLTGMIAGLLPQLGDAFDAAELGVFLHGLAGDIAADELTEYCVTADDILAAIPEAFGWYLGKSQDAKGKRVEAQKMVYER